MFDAVVHDQVLAIRSYFEQERAVHGSLTFAMNGKVLLEGQLDELRGHGRTVEAEEAEEAEEARVGDEEGKVAREE